MFEIDKIINTVINGDALSVLKQIPDESIDCVVTSPPYFNLRNYGIDGQIGLESTVDEYINKLCDIFDETKRVLKNSGSLWVNLGDTYAGSGNGTNDYRTEANKSLSGKRFEYNAKFQAKQKKASTKAGYHDSERYEPRASSPNMQAKSLMLIPFRFAIEMQNRGWIIRNVCIWHKRNCMPTSVKDRFTVDFEYFFFMTKSKKYYFEQQFEKPTFTEKTKRPSGMQRQAKNYRDKVYGGAGTSFQGRNFRTVWTIKEPLMQLRQDLTDEQKSYVFRKLLEAGLI